MAADKRVTITTRVQGAIFCFLWYFSIYFGFLFLICPILLLLFIKPKLFRKWTDLIFAIWELYPVAMMEIWFGVKIKINGDTINPFEGSIIIMNHRTRLDWNFLWAAVHHSCHPLAHNMKFVLKAPVMHVPGPGWVMQICSFLFIHRSWERDKQLIGQMLDYLRDSGQTCQILIFPEGTDLTEKNLEKSHKFAEKQGLMRYYRVLHPKTTGFAYLAKHMMHNGQLQAVYDLTVGYSKTIPQTELDMVRGKFPEELHFQVKRYDSSHLPRDEEELKNWLNLIWKEKETKLQRFYLNGSFLQHDCTPDCSQQNCTNEKINMSGQKLTEYCNGQNKTEINELVHIPNSQNDVKTDYFECYGNTRPNNSLYIGLLFWTAFVLLSFYMLFTNFYIQIWSLFYSLLFLSFSFFTNGFHMMVARYLTSEHKTIIKKQE